MMPKAIKKPKRISDKKCAPAANLEKAIKAIKPKHTAVNAGRYFSPFPQSHFGSIRSNVACAVCPEGKEWEPEKKFG